MITLIKHIMLKMYQIRPIKWTSLIVLHNENNLQKRIVINKFMKISWIFKNNYRIEKVTFRSLERVIYDICGLSYISKWLWSKGLGFMPSSLDPVAIYPLENFKLCSCFAWVSKMIECISKSQLRLLQNSDHPTPTPATPSRHPLAAVEKVRVAKFPVTHKTESPEISAHSKAMTN